MEFGDHEDIEDYDDFDLPYEQHFGGSILMNKKHYELSMVTQMSIGDWDMKIIDLLVRMVVKNIPLRVSTR